MTPSAKTLEAMYLMLCQMKPFKSWNLPNTACINFVVTDEEDSYGTYVFDDDIHIITISKAKCSHFETILKTGKDQLNVQQKGYIADLIISLRDLIVQMKTVTTIQNPKVISNGSSTQPVNSNH